jgi:hypothetical protein
VKIRFPYGETGECVEAEVEDRSATTLALLEVHPSKVQPGADGFEDGVVIVVPVM